MVAYPDDAVVPGSRKKPVTTFSINMHDVGSALSVYEGWGRVRG